MSTESSSALAWNDFVFSFYVKVCVNLLELDDIYLLIQLEWGIYNKIAFYLMSDSNMSELPTFA